MKNILMLLILLFSLAMPSFAIQYPPDTGMHRYDATPSITYERFISALDILGCKIKSTDSKNYVTLFSAQGYEFVATIIPDGKKEALLQIVPTNSRKLVPLNIYIKIIHMTGQLISNPNTKGRTYVFTN